jgi:PBP1b-binding outer membrane lipoprotein LpoB
MRALTHLTVLAISGFVVGCSARVAPAVPVADLPVSTPQQTQVPDVMPSVALVIRSMR